MSAYSEIVAYHSLCLGITSTYPHWSKGATLLPSRKVRIRFHRYLRNFLHLSFITFQETSMPDCHRKKWRSCSHDWVRSQWAWYIRHCLLEYFQVSNRDKVSYANAGIVWPILVERWWSVQYANVSSHEQRWVLRGHRDYSCRVPYKDC